VVPFIHPCIFKDMSAQEVNILSHKFSYKSITRDLLSLNQSIFMFCFVIDSYKEESHDLYRHLGKAHISKKTISFRGIQLESKAT